MKIVFFLFFPAMLQVNGLYAQRIIDFNSFNEDSLRSLLAISDSVKILKTNPYDTYYYSIAFIDYNKNSEFHSQLRKNRGDNFNKDYYDYEYNNQLKRMEITDKPRIPEEYVKKWIKLFKYDGDFYVYMDCDFQIVYQVTDTTFDSYGMDGANPDIIVKSETNEKSLRLVTVDDYKIEIIKTDTPGIFKIVLGKSCDYYTSMDMINQFNIIVHYCMDLTDDIIEFEKTDCDE